MQKALWIIALLGALVGALTILIGLPAANGAPQEAAAAGIALSFAIIPYCVARSAAALSGRKKLDEISTSLQSQTKLLAVLANEATRNRDIST